MARFLISSAIGDERIPTFKKTPLTFGRAHYSWKIVADLYRRGLVAAGHDVLDLLAPDAYQTTGSKKLANILPDDISLIIKPTEFIRPCFDTRNIAICGWEFPEFNRTSHGGDPRTNQIAMLKAVDDIWCWSDYTAANLQQFGVTARRLPPPVLLDKDDARETLDDIPCATLDSIECLKTTEPFGDVLKRYNGRKYLTIINPFDKRKGVVIEVEAAVAELLDGDLLIIKIIIDNEGTCVENMNAILDIHYGLNLKSPSVVFIGEYLTSGQLNALYDLCDYYLCCSSAEGLNLPLIEAMSKSLLAISTKETAMGDYISTETAVVIESKRAPTGESFHAASDYLKTTHYPTNVDAVRKAVRESRSLSASKLRLLTKNGSRKVAELYGLERFQKDVTDAAQAR